MLSAVTKNGQLITLASLSKREIHDLRSKDSFYCPACNNEVIVKAGDITIPHFAHLKSQHCPEKGGGEGEYHYRGKLLLYEWFLQQQIDVELEPYLPQIHQRPDLLLRIKDRMIAIEYQCAKIDPKIIYERNKGYKRANIIPIWVLGANQFKRITANHIKINRFTLSFIHRFSKDHPTSLFYFCPLSKQLSFIQDIIITSPHKALAKLSFFPLSKATFFNFFLKQFFIDNELYSLWRQEKRVFRLRKNSNFGAERHWLNWLYHQHLHIDYLPAHIFLPVRSQYKMKVPLWNWQSRFLLDFLQRIPKDGVFSTFQAERFLKRYLHIKVDKELIHYDDSPLIEYCYLLCQTGILKQVSMTKFKKLLQPDYYKQIEEALNGDGELLRYFMYNRIQ